MAQRLALRTKVRELEGDRIIFFSDLKEFVRRADELELGPRSHIRTEYDEEAKEFFFWFPLPSSSPRLADGRKRKIVRKTKKQKEVEAQIAEHKKNKAAGVETKGHIPPVGGRKKKRKIKRSNA